MAQWPGEGRDPCSYPPRQEGVRPGRSLPQLPGDSCPRCPSPAGDQGPPTLPSLRVPGHCGDLEEPACGGSRQNQRDLHVPAPLAHIAHSWTWAEAGRAPGQHSPSRCLERRVGECRHFPGTSDAAQGCWKEFWAPSRPWADRPFNVRSKPPRSGPRSRHLNVVDMGSLESSRI